MAFGEPAHGDLTALALDLLGLDRASLLGDVEESLEEHGKSPLLLVRLRRRRWDDGRDMWFSPPAHAHAPAPLRRASWALGRKRRLVHLRVVGPERGAGPARLRDQVFEEEDVVAQVGRVAQLVGE